MILTLVKLIGDESLEDKPSINLVDDELIKKIKSIILENLKFVNLNIMRMRNEIEELIDNFLQKWKSLEPEIYGYMDISKLNQKNLCLNHSIPP